MARVAYAGRDDLRILNGHDLRKASVSGFSTTEFPKDQPIEVDDEVMVALLGNPDLYGQFVVVQDEVEQQEAEEDHKPATAKKNATKTESSQSDTGNQSSQ